MAKKLIEELVINVKQKGAPAVERQLNRIVDTLEDAAVGTELLNSELVKMPRLLKDVEASANKATAGLRNTMSSQAGSAAMEEQLSQISDALLELSGNSIQTNEILEDFAKDSLQAFDKMGNGIVAELERIQDETEKTARSNTKLTDTFEEVANATNKVTASGGRAARGLGNQNRQGRNAVRTLGDLVNIAGPMVNAYAAVAANVFAVSEALRLLVEGSSIERL